MNKQKIKGKWANSEKSPFLGALQNNEGGFIGKKCLWAQFEGPKHREEMLSPVNFVDLQRMLLTVRSIDLTWSNKIVRSSGDAW